MSNLPSKNQVSWFYEYQALLAACAAIGYRPAREPDPNFGGERVVLVPMRQHDETTAVQCPYVSDTQGQCHMVSGHAGMHQWFTKR